MTNDKLYDLQAMYAKFDTSGIPAASGFSHQNITFLISKDNTGQELPYSRNVRPPKDYNGALWNRLNTAYTSSSDIFAVSQDVADTISPFLRDVGVVLHQGYAPGGSGTYFLEDSFPAFGFHSYVLSIKQAGKTLQNLQFNTEDKKISF